MSRRARRGRAHVKVRGDLRIEHLARWTGRRDADGRLETRFALEARADSAGFQQRGRDAWTARAASADPAAGACTSP